MVSPVGPRVASPVFDSSIENEGSTQPAVGQKRPYEDSPPNEGTGFRHSPHSAERTNLTAIKYLEMSKRQKTDSRKYQIADSFLGELKALGIEDIENPMPFLQKNCNWKNGDNLTHNVFRLPDAAVLTWKNGPYAGKIYDLIKVSATPSYSKQELIEKIDKGLHEIKSGSMSAEDLHGRLYLDYFGSADKPGLEKARFSEKELDAILSEIERVGVGRWLNNRHQELGLHSTYAYSSDDESEDEDGGKHIKNSGKKEVFVVHAFTTGMPGNSRELKDFFQPVTDSPPDLSAMAASHTTYSESLSGIINAGALLSSDMVKEWGLMQLSGEGGRGSTGYTSKHVSLSVFNDKTGKFLSGGFGSALGFSYPMNWLINDENLKKLNCESISSYLSYEKCVKDAIPLSLITAVSVPPFAKHDVERKLNQHGHGHIEVLPLTKTRRG